MAARIVLFGATGFTGELTARALVGRGAAPVLAGRDEGRVAALGAELGAEHAVADAARPETLRALLGRGDVLVSTVGPFARLGGAAVQAAVGAGAHYLDSTGEAPFVREVFAAHGPRAARAGSGLLTAFGFDFVPGNLAGALALRGAHGRAARVEVGYFVTGGGWGAASRGTRSSAAGVLLARAHAWRGGALVLEAPGRRRRTFTVGGRRRGAISVGGTEALALPRLGRVEEVTTFLGAPAGTGALARGAGLVARAPGVRGLAGRLAGGDGGPDAEARARTTARVVALAADGAGLTLAESRLRTANPYEVTAGLLAWGAERAAAGALRGTGALGPVDAFGLEALRAGAAEAGCEVAA